MPSAKMGAVSLRGVLNLCSGIHARTLKDRSRGSQPVGSVLLCQDVSGCVRTCQSHRTLSAAACRTAPRRPRGRSGKQ
jgi:hypothetical protein